MSIAKSSIIYPNVILGDNIVIEDFCIIGCPPRQGEIKPTIIEANSVIRSHTVIYSGNIIGSGFQTGHKANIRENNTIGNNVSVGSLSNIEYDTTIADEVRIHTQVFIPEFTQIGKRSWLGPNVVITNSKYPVSKKSKTNLIGCQIQENVIIGANSTILPGLSLGNFSMVGAGSVLVKNADDYSVYVGNPAGYLKDIREISDYEINTIL